MIIPPRFNTVENFNYSAYKKEKFHEYQEKLDKIIRGIKDSKLNDKDKQTLKQNLIKRLE